MIEYCDHHKCLGFKDNDIVWLNEYVTMLENKQDELIDAVNQLVEEVKELKERKNEK